MVKHRIQKWLMDHPKVLSLLFGLLVASSKLPDISTKSGSTAWNGP